jgi:hypothetical protein
MAIPKIALPSYELVVPSTDKKIKYRPFLVKEEKVLLIALENKDDKDIEKAVKDLLKNCVITRGFKLEDLATFDLEYIFLKIRAASVGDSIDMKVVCLDDNKTEVTAVINIDDVNVEFPEGHSKKIMLDEETGVIMKYPGFNRFIESSITSTDLSTDDVFEIIAESIDQIFQGEEVYDSSTTTKKEFLTFVENLTNSQFEKIQEFFETAPKLSHTFSVVNPNTSETSTYTIEGLSSFFG